MREVQVGVSGKGSIEALISPFRPLAQYQRARPSFSELRHPMQKADALYFPRNSRKKSAIVWAKQRKLAEQLQFAEPLS